MRDAVISKAQMLEVVDEIFRSKRSKQSLRRVLYFIYVRRSIEEGRRQADRGQTIPHEKVMEEMWRQINTGLSGRRKHSSSSGKSSRK